MTEKQLQEAIVKIATLHGWMHFHVFDSRRSDPGWPDLVLVHPVRGEILFAELKAEKGKVSAAQHRWLSALELAGQETHVWRPADLQQIAERLGRRP